MMLEYLLESLPVADPSAIWLTVILDVSFKGLLVLLCGLAITGVLRRASAATRHLIWTLAFGALLALPVLSVMLPEWRVPIIPDDSRFSELTTVATPLNWDVSPNSLSTTEVAELSSAKRIARPASPPWTTIALGVWVAGAVVLFVMLLFGHARVRWLAARAHPLTSGSCAILAERLRADLGVRRPVRLLESSESTMPMAWGLLSPVVLLPAGAGHWTAARQRAVLLHELAHIRRHDPLAHLFAELTCAFYWFNPVVWLAARRLRIEREYACDDQVLRAGSKASDYAMELLNTARTLRAEQITSFAAVAMARPSQLSGRLLAVLDGTRNRQDASRRIRLPAVAGAIALIVPLAALNPMTQAADPNTVYVPGVFSVETRSETKQAGFEGIGDDRFGSALAAVSDTILKWVAGTPHVTEVENEAEIAAVAADISSSSENINRTTQNLRTLFNLPGAGLYLQFNNSIAPFTVVLIPSETLGEEAISMQINTTITLRASRESPEAETPYLGIFWVDGGAQERYVLRVPKNVAHVTIVANGRVVVSGRQIKDLRTPASFRVN